MRYLSHRLHIPYTLSMLSFGFASALIADFLGYENMIWDVLSFSQKQPAISSSMILYIFLPALVFEGAFSLDPHVFKKSFGVIALLAGPALFMNTLLVAVLMYFLNPSWDWSLSLIFGALISATDPVAVTAILREQGLSKPIITIIEGESLFNDGLTIVLFSMLLTFMSGQIESIGLLQMLWFFSKAVFGGALVGFFLASLASFCMNRLFRDPLLEISLTLILGYSCMLLAEEFFLVSGVIAVAVAGQCMARSAKMRIANEVRFFLHQFWEILVYIINTLLFFMVGYLSALLLESASYRDLILITQVYVGIMIIRLLVTFLFRSILASLGQKISLGHTFLISWSGMRGAVSLSLVLIFFHQEQISFALRSQVLLVTTGVVFLSMFINGSSVKFLLDFFKIDQPNLAQTVSSLLVQSNVLDKVYDRVQRMSKTRRLQSFTWSDIKQKLFARQIELQQRMSEAKDLQEKESQELRDEGYWIRVLNMEKAAYWEAFRQGILQEGAAKTLIHEVELQLTHGVMPPREKRMPSLEKSFFYRMHKLLQPYQFFHKLVENIEFYNIFRFYHLAYGLQMAAATVLRRIENMKRIDPALLQTIRITYRGYLHNSKKRIEEMRQYLPRVTRAIETRLAHRMIFIQEKNEYEHLLQKGSIGESMAKQCIESIEEELSVLNRQVKKEKSLPSVKELLREMHIFRSWSEADRNYLAEHAVNVILSPDETLFYQGESGTSLYIICRGAMNVIERRRGLEKIIGVLGGGDILGEMSLLSGRPRNATVRAATAVSLIRIDRQCFIEISQKQASLLRETWLAFARHSLDNYLREDDKFINLDSKSRKEWIEQGKLEKIAKNQRVYSPSDAEWAYLVSGKIEMGMSYCEAGTFFSLEKPTMLKAEEESSILYLFKLWQV